MLFASTPAIAEPALSIEGGPERFEADQNALRQKLYGGSFGISFTFCSAVVRGATLGVSDIVMRLLGDPDSPVLDEARKVNPRTSAVGTVLGGIVLASLVYLSLLPVLWRRRDARKPLRPIPTVEPPAAPDGIVGYFVTRDGYEFVVTRQSRKADDAFN